MAAAMVLLPLAYLALVALVGWGAAYHALHHWTWLAGRWSYARLLGYLTPIAAGAMALFFMTRTLFTRRPPEAEPTPLSPADEPLLFAFLERLCRAVGTPVPAEVRVDTQVNASAGLHLGLADLRGGRLVLTLGLPVVADLSLRQFTGVLAHELGHFSQRGGMRVATTIRKVSGWFARVVFERDDWDRWLVEQSERGTAGVALLALAARAAVGLARLVLGGLMLLGQALSCVLTRQMEYEADLFEVQVAGSAGFGETMLRLRFLAAAAARTAERLGPAWRERRLLDDLPRQIAEAARTLPAEVAALERARSQEATTGFLDTHPADRDRVARALAAAQPAAFALELPARALFRNFDALSRRATLEFYQRALGAEVSESNLVPSEAFASAEAARTASTQAAERYFQGFLRVDRPLFPPARMERPAGDGCTALRQAREEFETACGPAREAFARFEQALALLYSIERADELRRVGIEVDVAELGLAKVERGAPRETLRTQGLALQEAALPDLTRLEAAAQARLAVAFGLDAPAGPVAAALAALRALEKTHGHVRGLHAEMAFLADLLLRTQDREEEVLVGRRVIKGFFTIEEQLGRVRAALAGTPYPFDPAPAADLAGFVAPPLPASPDRGMLFAAGRRALESHYDVYLRAMGVVALAAEAAETRCGLRPLAAPGNPGGRATIERDNLP